MFVAAGAVEQPFGVYADRFGIGYSVGAGFWLKTRSRWLLGLDFTYTLHNQVRESVLDSVALRTVGAANQLAGSDAQLADVRITGRSYRFPVVRVGRVWPARLLPGAGANAGVFGTVGAGFWQHKINFEDVSGTATPLRGAYVKGYDRLTNGVVLTQTLGYLHLSRQRRINFFLALEASEGFTQNRRSWDYSTQRRDDRQRLDLLFGARVGWLFTVYKKLPREYYYD